MADLFARLCLTLALWALLPAASFAHDRTLSFSAWTLAKDQVTVTLTLNAIDLEGLRLADGAALSRYATERLQLIAAGEPQYPHVAPQRLAAPAGRVRLQWSYSVRAGDPREIRCKLFQPDLPGHLHFASVSDGTVADERVLNSSDPNWKLGANPTDDGRTALSTLADYVTLGVEHIATGLDHLVFLFALLLAGRHLRHVVQVVTGFTVGHSISLAAAVLGLVHPQAEAVEAMIGLSIAIVAVECEWMRAGRDRLLPGIVLGLLFLLGVAAVLGFTRVPVLCWWGLTIFLGCYYALAFQQGGRMATPWPVALIFGLIHGLGFASALVEAGLPSDHLGTALLGFNVGVELGQLLLVAVVWPLLKRALKWRPDEVVQSGAALCLSMGTFWLVSRGL